MKCRPRQYRMRFEVSHILYIFWKFWGQVRVPLSILRPIRFSPSWSEWSDPRLAVRSNFCTCLKSTVHVVNSQRITIHLPQKRFSHNGIWRLYFCFILFWFKINFIPVELCVCRKDLQFGVISNHSDWGTFSELKYNLSYIFFKTISISRILNNCFIVCPKHTYRCDLVFMYFSVRKWRPRPRSRGEIAYFKLPSILRKIKRCWTFQCINRK